MPTARGGVAAAAAPDGKIYAIGGYGNTGYLAKVEEYDPATDTWKARAPMPTARGYLAAAAAPDGKIYAIGGYVNGGYLATVEEYDPATDTWTARAPIPMPTARYGLAAAAAPDGKIYAIGGYGNGSYLATVEEFTPPTGEQYGYHILRSTLRGALSLPEGAEVWDNTVNGSVSAGNYSLVQNTNAGGSIGIGSGLVVSSTAGGGISISNGAVLSNTVRGGGISAGSGSAVRANSVENAPGWAISGGAATVAENRLVGNANGIQVSGGVVEYNLIANTAGVGLELAGSATVRHNTFTGIGGSAVRITAGTVVTLTGNNFEFNTGAYDVEDLVPKTSLPTVDARGNWWGATNEATIQQRIFDFYDDYTLGTVLYSPILTGPSALAPAYARAVTLTPESPVGIQTVAFAALFSREMDTDVAPQLAFAGLGGEYTEFYGGSWSGPNLYRALYDFSTLVPRGVYTLTVSGARLPETAPYGGGMEIAPYSGVTFTVDYAGYINDTTAPPKPMVTACAAATPDILSAAWSAHDPDSAIDRYQYAIGLTPGGAEVVNWTFTPLTQTVRVGLNLIAGRTYYISVKARNEAGLWSAAGSVGVVAGSNTCNVNDAPTVTSIVRLDASPTSAASVRFRVTFSEAVTGVDTGDFSLTVSGITGAAVTEVSGAGEVYTVTVSTGSGSGTLRLDIPAGTSITDLANNPLSGLPYTGGESYTVDKTAPTVVSGVRLDPSPTNAASARFRVTFSEAVTGVDTGDFSLTVTGITGAAVTEVSGAGEVYTVTVSTGSGSGTLRLDIPAGTSITDLANNPLSGLPYTGGESYTVDKTAPTVVSSVRLDASPTSAASARFRVTFSEAVTGVDTGDFSLTVTGITGAAVTEVSGTGEVYTVTVSTGSGSGTLRLDIPAGASITDLANNPLSGLPYTGGESYTVDKTAPTVVSIVRLDANPTSAASVRFRVAFSEAVTGVETGDFSLTVSGVSGAAVTEVSGASAVYTVTVSTGSGSGTLRLDIPAGASITDLGGNSLSGLPYTRGEAYMVRPNFIFLPLVLRNTP